MPRTYLTNKTLPSERKLQAVPTAVLALEPWEDGKLLHDLKAASVLLTAYLGSGYSVSKLRRRIKSGAWQEGAIAFRTDGLWKLNLRAIVRWQLGNID